MSFIKISGNTKIIGGFKLPPPIPLDTQVVLQPDGEFVLKDTLGNTLTGSSFTFTGNLQQNARGFYETYQSTQSPKLAGFYTANAKLKGYRGTLTKDVFVPGIVVRQLSASKLAGSTSPASVNRGGLYGNVATINLSGNATIGASLINFLTVGPNAINIGLSGLVYTGEITAPGSATSVSQNTMRFTGVSAANLVRDYYLISAQAPSLSTISLSSATFPLTIYSVPTPPSIITPVDYWAIEGDAVNERARFFLRPDTVYQFDFLYNGVYYWVRDINAPLNPEAQAEYVNGVQRPIASINTGSGGLLYFIVPIEIKPTIVYRRWSSLPVSWWNDSFYNLP